MSREPETVIQIAEAEGGSVYVSRFEGQPAFPRICNLMGAVVEWPMPARRPERGTFAKYDLLVVGGDYLDAWDGETHPERMARPVSWPV